jgi:SPX domain protein involved in polyphosphate accumulation
VSDYRYEIKFILDESEFSRALSWLSACTSSRLAYPSRTVNSVYFDDLGYSALRDNLAGISERYKIRLRWYHGEDREKINDVNLEVKHRKERLGYKDSYALSGFEKKLLKLEYRDLFPSLHAHLGGDSVFLMEDHFCPMLQVSYLREYFEGLNGIRVTLDRSINFYSPLPHLRPFEGLSVSYPNSVMEIKFTPEQKNNVETSLRHLNLTPKRHSKYMVGLATFGYAVYY